MKDVIEIRWAVLEPEDEDRTDVWYPEKEVLRTVGQKTGKRPPASARARQGHRLSSLGKRLLSDILQARYGIDLSREKDPIARHPLGKPYLTGHEELHFSISHSESWAACAVGQTPVGLDIQYRKNKKTDLLASRILDAQEFTAYQNAPDPDVSFYDFWVKKESYLKYTGEGIRKDLRTVRYEGCRFFFLPDMIEGCAATLCVPADWKGTIKITEQASGKV